MGHKRFLMIVISLVLAIGLVLSTGEVMAKKYKIGWAMESMSHPWLVQHVNQGKEIVAKHDDVELLVADGQDKIEKMIGDIEDFIVRDVDFILITPGKTVGLKAALRKVKQAGIPYGFVGKGYIDPNAVFFMADDNFQAGQILGHYTNWLLGSTGNIVELFGIPGDATAMQRSQGFHDVIDKIPGLKVIANIPADYRREPAVKAVEDILQANPKGTIQTVFAHNGEMGLGAAIAVKKAGRTGEFFITTIDAGKWEVAAIGKGELGASASYRVCGHAAMSLAIGYVKGQIKPDEIPNRISPPGLLVTPVNWQANMPKDLFAPWNPPLADIVKKK